MKRNILICGVILTLTLSFTGCNNKSNQEENNQKNHKEVSLDVEDNKKELESKIIKTYENKEPKYWGENLDNVLTHIKSDKKQVALTLDACGGKNGSKYDKELIDFLKKEKIPATLFINYRWIEKNEDIFLSLAKDDNFQIENHGYGHKPLSVNGKSIYNIEGTKNIKEVIEEIKLNEEKIYKLTNRKTKYFRSGTAYYDEIAIKIAKDLGYKIAGFSINSDGGATFSKNEVINALSYTKKGDIIIGHFNQPKGNTYEGLKEALIDLKNQGYEFVKLGE